MIGRIHTPRTWLADSVALVRSAPRLLAIFGRGRVDGALRERVMVAVSRANGCEACTRAHEAWALRAGISADALEQLGAGDLALLPVEERAAIVYATALAESCFGVVPRSIEALTDTHLDRQRKRDIEAIGRLMTFANLSLNAVHSVARSLRPRGATPGARAEP